MIYSLFQKEEIEALEKDIKAAMRMPASAGRDKKISALQTKLARITQRVQKTASGHLDRLMRAQSLFGQ